MKNLYIFLLFLLAISVLEAQNASDKIIAVIGNKIILESDINNIISDAKRNNQPLPEDARCVLLETMLTQKLLALQAERDSLPVTEDEIQTEMDNRIRRMTQVYGSKAMLEEIAGQSIGELKKDMHDMFKEQLLAKAMQNKVVNNVKFTPKEVKSYFNTILKDSLPYYEEEVEVGTIVVYPESSPDLDRYIIKQLTEFRQQILDKKVPFSMLAERESEDPSVVENKGLFELNINDKQMWDPTFFTAAFKLKGGQISPVVKSKFGYHIIEMIHRDGDNASIRHILKIPQPSKTEIEKAQSKMDTIRSKLIAGGLSFSEAIALYDQDETSRFTGGIKLSQDGKSTYVTLENLDSSLVKTIRDMKIGEYSYPQLFADPTNGKQGFRIVYLKSRSKAHRESLEYDFDKIADRVVKRKTTDVLQTWFYNKLPNFYLRIIPEYQSCIFYKKLNK